MKPFATETDLLLATKNQLRREAPSEAIADRVHYQYVDLLCKDNDIASEMLKTINK